MKIERELAILDGHVDSLKNCDVEMRDFLEESERGHVDLPRAHRGGLGGMLASIYLRPNMVETDAVGYAIKYFDDLLRLGDRAGGAAAIVRTADDLDRCFEDGTFALVPHFEGAEPISRSLKELRLFYEAGLRSLGIVHARANLFGDGVPVPWAKDKVHGVPTSQHDWGLRNGRQLPVATAGLTDLGRELVYECQQLGIVVDVSHLTWQGFWDTLEVSQRPLIASHSSAHAICPHDRNLSDDMLRALANHGGVVGINFMVVFVRPDMKRDPDLPVELLLDHISHCVNVMGDDHVGIGTDFDGAVMPSCIDDASKLPLLVEGMRTYLKYDDERIAKICNGNFRRVLREAWNN